VNYKKVLVLSAHPDDLELGAGGTVRKLVSSGAKVDNLIMVPNVPHKRHLEISSKLLGFNPIYFENDSTDRPILNNNTVSKVESLIDVKSYDLIISHWKEDWHQDHRLCHELTNIIRRVGKCDVWYMESWPYNHKYESFRSSVYVDISNEIAEKTHAINAYLNLPDDLSKKIAGYNSYRANFIRCEYAEVFSADTIIHR